MELLSDFQKSIHIKVSCIYKITNKINNKVYIGQTVNFRKRLSDYRNLNKKQDERPITIAVKEDGIENFTIEIIEFCEPWMLSLRENYWIQYFKARDERYGYNYVENNSSNQFTASSRTKMSIAHLGLKEPGYVKKKKSNVILAIRDSTIIVCDSGKLFGDFIGNSKDKVKNCLRLPSRMKEYRLYYDDFNKRQEIRHKMEKKKCIKDIGYMIMLDKLDEIEREGVETIYTYFDRVYHLEYTEDGQSFVIVEYDLDGSILEILYSEKELFPDNIVTM